MKDISSMPDSPCVHMEYPEICVEIGFAFIHLFTTFPAKNSNMAKWWDSWNLEYDSIFCACCGGMAEVQEYPCPGRLAWSMCRLDHGRKSGFLTLCN